MYELIIEDVPRFSKIVGAAQKSGNLKESYTLKFKGKELEIAEEGHDVEDEADDEEEFVDDDEVENEIEMEEEEEVRDEEVSSSKESSFEKEESGKELSSISENIPTKRKSPRLSKGESKEGHHLIVR